MNNIAVTQGMRHWLHSCLAGHACL